jgi:hypothetical protein
VKIRDLPEKIGTSGHLATCNYLRNFLPFPCHSLNLITSISNAVYASGETVNFLAVVNLYQIYKFCAIYFGVMF